MAQLTKAVATDRGWRHFRHADLLAAARQIDEESDNAGEVRDAIEMVRSMRTNFHEVDLDRIAVERGFTKATTLLEAFWQLLPERYANGSSFARWLADASG